MYVEEVCSVSEVHVGRKTDVECRYFLKKNGYSTFSSYSDAIGVVCTFITCTVLRIRVCVSPREGG